MWPQGRDEVAHLGKLLQRLRRRVFARLRTCWLPYCFVWSSYRRLVHVVWLGFGCSMVVVVGGCSCWRLLLLAFVVALALRIKRSNKKSAGIHRGGGQSSGKPWAISGFFCQPLFAWDIFTFTVGKPLFILFYESIFRNYSVFMTDRLTQLVYDFISSTTKKVSKTKKDPEPIFCILILIPSRSKHSRFDPDFYKDPLTTSTDQVFSFQSYFPQRSPYYFNDTISEFASTISFHRSSPEYLVQISS
jgi:hypothetical protein